MFKKSLDGDITVDDFGKLAWFSDEYLGCLVERMRYGVDVPYSATSLLVVSDTKWSSQSLISEHFARSFATQRKLSSFSEAYVRRCSSVNGYRQMDVRDGKNIELMMLD